MNVTVLEKKPKYILTKVNKVRAQAFWDRSAQNSFFTNPEQISLFEENMDWWIITKGSEELCMWGVCSTVLKKVYIPSFSYYFGPTWSQSFLKIPEHSKLNTYIKIYDLCFEKFNKTLQLEIDEN